MNKRNVWTAAASVAVIAGALTLFAACDWGSAPKAQTANVEDLSLGRSVYPSTYIRINPKDRKYAHYATEIWGKVEMWNEGNSIDHTDTYWQYEVYSHTIAKLHWDDIQNYGLEILGSAASIEYQEDKRSGLHYDHWHWYLVVDGVRIAEYEKVGGKASAAYDYVRLLKSWWDWKEK